MFATGLATDIIAELDEVGGGYVPCDLFSTASAWPCLESRTYVCCVLLHFFLSSHTTSLPSSSSSPHFTQPSHAYLPVPTLTPCHRLSLLCPSHPPYNPHTPSTHTASPSHSSPLPLPLPLTCRCPREASQPPCQSTMWTRPSRGTTSSSLAASATTSRPSWPTARDMGRELGHTKEGGGGEGRI